MSDTSDPVLERARAREVAGVLRSRQALDETIADLLLAGFDRADIDISGTLGELREKLGTTNVAAKELADVARAPRRPFVGREDITITTALVVAICAFGGATIGALSVIAAGASAVRAAAAALAGAVIVGGIAAMAVARAVRRSRFDEALAATALGGYVLWVTVRSPEREAQAQEILLRHAAEAVRVHEIDIEKRAREIPLSSLRPDPWLGAEPLGRP